MAEASVYLNFPGNTEEAFKFYKSILGGEFTAVQRWKEMPGSEKIPEGDREKIMHISLPVGKSSVIAATDSLESMGQKVNGGNNFHICLAAKDEKEADSLFAGLSAGGKITMPLEKAFWGSYFGMLVDKFGIAWMIISDITK